MSQPTYTFWQSVGFAMAGLRTLWASERHFRIHCGIALLVVALSVVVHLRPWAWCVVLLTIGGMLVTEALNTAIEKLVDRIDTLDAPENRGCHPLGKHAKDVAAAACLVWAIVSVGVGMVVLGPPVWQWAVSLTL